MKTWMSACLAALLMMLMAAPALAAYDVMLPDGYEETDSCYPVVYLLPENGYDMDESGMAQLLSGSDALEAIIVRPAFEAGSDPLDALRGVMAEVDGAYRTMDGRMYRALMGTGAGGYLSYALGLEMMDDIGAMVSIRGDFAGNPWVSACGSVKDKLSFMRGRIDSVYTYLDAPVEDAYSNQAGGTNELGALFIGFGTGSACHEYTVRPGAFDDAFLAESVSRAADRLSTWMFGEEEEEAAPPVDPLSIKEETVIDGEMQTIALHGAWHFQYTGAKLLDVSALTPAEFGAWDVVLPGGGSWTKGYGNISDENVTSGYGPDYFDYFITENGYYARTFTMPENFDAQEIVLAIGYVDDRCEVFVNGVRVGATGMDESGNPTGETTWAAFSHFDIDPALIIRGGENTVVVRAYNDLPFGAGGWYGGPTALMSRAAFDAAYGQGAKDRFMESTFPSECAANALGETAPYENPYLIYLPEGYEDSGKAYPTVYLLHQFNSDHTSYRIDKVDQLFDEGVREGLFDEMIVVVPASSGESWWAGDWEKMITEELIPHIDANYRTVRDARYRLTAGCSMGGQGAMAVALRNPDFFSGAVSFYGAFSYGGALSPNAIALQESEAYMDAFSLYFICGNQDSYGFGVPAIELHQQLEKMGVNHRFFIDNGGHDGGFYLPFFKDAFAYIRSDMYQPEGNAAAYLRGSFSLDSETKALTAQVDVLPGIEQYLYTVPSSAYTKNENPPLDLGVRVAFVQDGKTVYEDVTHADIEGGDTRIRVTMDIPDEIDTAKPFRVTLSAQMLGSDTVLANITAE